MRPLRPTPQPDYSSLYQQGGCIHDDEASANARNRGLVEDTCPAAAAARQKEADLDDDLQDRARRRSPKQSAARYGLTACAPRTSADHRRQAGERGEAGEDGERRAGSRVSGAAMPMPSVTLWMAKPTTRKVASAAAPVASAAPTARPSPRLCRPMPSAMKKASASALRRAARRGGRWPRRTSSGQRRDDQNSDVAAAAGRAPRRRARAPRQRVDEQEQQQPDGQRQQEASGAGPPARMRGIGEQADAPPARRRAAGRRAPSVPSARRRRSGVGRATSIVCSKAAPVRGEEDDVVRLARRPRDRGCRCGRSPSRPIGPAGVMVNTR